MVLHKSLKDNLGGGPTSGASILGLKVMGGKLLPNGRFGAVIEKVKKGSAADTIGHLLPGKTIIIWKYPLVKSLKDNLGGGLTSGASILGLKVMGGKLLPNGRFGAVIEKVKKGSAADTIGHLLPGKTIIIWKYPLAKSLKDNLGGVPISGASILGLNHPKVNQLLGD